MCRNRPPQRPNAGKQSSRHRGTRAAGRCAVTAHPSGRLPGKRRHTACACYYGRAKRSSVVDRRWGEVTAQFRCAQLGTWRHWFFALGWSPEATRPRYAHRAPSPLAPGETPSAYALSIITIVGGSSLVVWSHVSLTKKIVFYGVSCDLFHPKIGQLLGPTCARNLGILSESVLLHSPPCDTNL